MSSLEASIPFPFPSQVYCAAAAIILLVCLVLVIVFVVRRQAGECADSFLLQSRSSLDGEPWWERAAVARRMSIDANTCRVCQKPTTTQCSQCKSVKYCGPVCQRKDWGSGHKFECQNLRNLKHHAAKAVATTTASAGGGGHSSSTSSSSSKPPFLDPNEDAPVPRQVLFPYELFLQLRKAQHSCRRAPVGLINHGNNCYANAALQCLLYTKPLRAYLDQDLHSKDCNRPHDRDWCLLCVLSRLCHEMANAPLHAEMSLKPLLRHLRRFAKTMSYGRQEDAHEFFYSLLNTMEAIQLTNYGGKDRFDMRSQETTLVHHAFGGYLRSQVVCCGCGAASRRYEAALDLQLEVPAGVDRLEDVLQRHTADEVLDGDNCYACDGCKQRCRAKRSTRFEVAPNTLVLCLKRFGTGRFGKINKVLVYGEALDLGPFMAAGAMDRGPATYTLSGVVVHLDQMNSTSFGHYISYVRTWDSSSSSNGRSNGGSSHGQWYVCDDSRVQRTRASDVLSQNAYMLFYQRDTPKPAPSPQYVRPKPLLPLTAAQQQAAAAAAAAAAAPTTPRAQEMVVSLKANGVAAAAAGAAGQLGVRDTLQLDQRQQRMSVDAAVMAAAQVPLEQQQQQPVLLAAMHSQPPPPAQPDGSELLPRIATAPAALALLAGREGSRGSSSRDEDECGSHATNTSSCLADVSNCSTPSYQANGAAAAGGSAGGADAWPAANGSRDSSSGSSSSRLARSSLEQQQPEAAAAAGAAAPDAAAAAASLPAHTLRRRQRQKQQQQREQQQAAAAAGAAATPAGTKQAPPHPLGAAGAATEAALDASGSSRSSDDSSSSSSLPSIQHRVVVAGPELLQLRAELPGITAAGEVRVAVESSGWQSEQQCLWLQVPGRFAQLQVQLSQHLQPGQKVGAVSGRFYRQKQQLKLKLKLLSSSSSAAAGSVSQQDAAAAAAAGQAEEVEYHLTDSFDTSSGSESESQQQGYPQPAARRSRSGGGGGMHAVASERDLCSIFGRHSSTVAHQLMQQLQAAAAVQAASSAPAAAGEQDGGDGGESGSGGSGAAGAAGPAKKAAAGATKKKAASKKKKRK